MINKHSVLVLGRTGQVGSSFNRIFGDSALYANSEECSFTNPVGMVQFLDKIKPKTIVNCAAYTAVDKAETERELTFQVNAKAPEVLAKWCADNNGRLIHFSTDYIFDGNSNTPYREQDTPNPQSIYGKSKLAGEETIRKYLREHLIFRISWVFSPFGHNFLKTMLKLGLTRTSLKVVSDQVGSPTYAPDIASAITKILLRDTYPYGTYHIHSEGETNWFEFAQFIFSSARELGWKLIIDKLDPISTAEFAAPAPRPLNSRMNTDLFQKNFGFHLSTWQDSTIECLKELRASQRSA